MNTRHSNPGRYALTIIGPPGSDRRSATMWAPVLRTALASLLLAFPLHALHSQPGLIPPPPAQADTSAQAEEAPAEVTPVSPHSPRAALERYLQLSRAGQHELAADYLDLPDSLRAAGATLARRFKVVLDRHVWFDLETVSPLASGDTADGLPAGIDDVGVIHAAGGIVHPIRLARVADAAPDADVQWRFSRTTVNRIPELYAALPDRWFIDHIPAPLLRPGPFELLWWQWFAALILVPAAMLLGYTVTKLAAMLLRRAASRKEALWGDAVVAKLAGPFTVGGALIAAKVAIPPLGLYQPAADRADQLIRAGFLIVVFWAIWRIVDVVLYVATQSTWARTVAFSRSLLPLGARVGKVIVAAVAVVALLSLVGYPVASLVAGLGLGGLALALAAQKTVENLFGAFSIGVDQPFREGDFVKIDDFVATVERIGLRSTRFRTLDRTLVSIPNGRVAEMKIESFAARDRLRLAFSMGLVYETTETQMRAVLEGTERTLRAHPLIWPDAVIVRFAGLGSHSLDIDVMAWFQTSDWGSFQLIRQEVLLQIMAVVEQAGTSFAFPTQTIHLAGDSAPQPAPA